MAENNTNINEKLPKPQIISESSSELTFSWPAEPISGITYLLQGLKKPLHFTTVLTTDQPLASLSKTTAKDYSGFRIISLFQGRPLHTSDCLAYRPSPAPDPITLQFLPSYDQKTALSLQHDHLYDLYLIYDCTDNKKELLFSTCDPIVITDQLHPDHTYLCEGYVYSEDSLPLLRGLSKPTSYQLATPRPLTSTPLLSVIVTLYNNENYLARCLDSILLSTLPSIEILIINDGSTDNSAKVARWYTEQYPFIRLITTNHQGTSGARNLGLARAHGSYIAYMDSDDYVHPYTYQKLYDAAKDEKADISIAQVIVRHDFKNHEIILNPFTGNKTRVLCTLADMMKNPGRAQKYFCSTVNKIVRTDLAKKVLFPGPEYYPYQLITYEDIAYTPALYSYADKFVVVKDAYYTWEKRHREVLGEVAFRGGNDDSILAWHATYIYARFFSIFNCNPAHRDLIDPYILNELREKYPKYKPYPELIKIFAKLLADAEQKFHLRDEPAIKSNPELLNFLNDILTPTP